MAPRECQQASLVEGFECVDFGLSFCDFQSMIATYPNLQHMCVQVTGKGLLNHSLRFHFELSFPPGNEQGIMYEPWHWRFVGSDHSALTFYGVQDAT